MLKKAILVLICLILPISSFSSIKSLEKLSGKFSGVNIYYLDVPVPKHNYLQLEHLISKLESFYTFYFHHADCSFSNKDVDTFEKKAIWDINNLKATKKYFDRNLFGDKPPGYIIFALDTFTNEIVAMCRVHQVHRGSNTIVLAAFAATYVDQPKNRGMGRKLLQTIPKVFPNIKKLEVHVDLENTKVLEIYSHWGFVEGPPESHLVDIPGKFMNLKGAALKKFMSNIKFPKTYIWR